ncbi:MAG: fluoride efflux transporter FluC [Actinomycetes bacterium]
MSAWLAVLLGGAVGAPLRYVVDRAVTERTASAGPLGRLPWGLFVVNVVGSALAGAVLATTSGDLRILLLVGLCGAFTTFSGFGWELSRLWDTARPAFWTSVIAKPVACVAAFLLVWRLAAALAG